MLEMVVDLLNLALDTIQVIFGGYINRFGLYIPTDPYTFIFWKDIVIAICLIFIIRYRSKWKKSKNHFDKRFHDYMVSENRIVKSAYYDSLQEKKQSWENFSNGVSSDYGFNDDSEIQYQMKIISEVKNMLNAGQTFLMAYENADGEMMLREVEPVRVYYYNGKWYFHGFCLVEGISEHSGLTGYLRFLSRRMVLRI